MPFTISQLKKRIEAGLMCIQNDQLSDGSFLSLSADNADLQNADTHKTTFVASLILSRLENVGSNARARKIIRGGVRYLLHEKSPAWSWNYWPRGKSQKKKSPEIPDDMDDTFAAMIAISIHRPDLVTPSVLAMLRLHLQQTKHLLTGLHNTWIIDYRANPKWGDADVVINSTIGYFLMRQGISAEGIAKTIEKALERIDKNTHISQYYSSPVAAFYFISRFLGPTLHLPQLPTPGDNALEMALTVSTLIHLEMPKATLRRYVQRLLDLPWNARGLYIESIKKKVPRYGGSEALTAVFCVEALAKYMIYE
jgi:hypothetical protein